MSSLPLLFLERLKTIIPSEHSSKVNESFSLPGPLTVRINTLKITKNDVLSCLDAQGIAYEQIPWYGDALLMTGLSRQDLTAHQLIREGGVYRQSLSSMLAPLALAPRPGERVLDMCAAPGSKTSQMAALMGNQGEIVAVEKVKDRYYKLKSVLTQTGVKNIILRLCDARRLPLTEGPFDKILVDAPCSSEGRFKTFDEKTYRYWSQRKIKEMAHKQKGLLLAASRFLKKDGILVYSTCSFAPEENEAVVDWFLRKAKGAFILARTSWPPVECYPPLLSWAGRVFDESVSHCLRILPGTLMEGFFLARLVRTR